MLLYNIIIKKLIIQSQVTCKLSLWDSWRRRFPFMVKAAMCPRS